MKNNTSYSLNECTIVLPASVIMTREISDGAKITLSYLLTFRNRDEIIISQAKVAENLSKSATTINKYYLQLEEKGYIILIRKPGYSHQVHFTTKSLSINENLN